VLLQQRGSESLQSNHLIQMCSDLAVEPRVLDRHRRLLRENARQLSVPGSIVAGRRVNQGLHPDYTSFDDQWDCQLTVSRFGGN
jgi:hypothetical protein